MSAHTGTAFTNRVDDCLLVLNTTLSQGSVNVSNAPACAEFKLSVDSTFTSQWSVIEDGLLRLLYLLGPITINETFLL